jgi:hypothetical protein
LGKKKKGKWRKGKIIRKKRNYIRIESYPLIHKKHKNRLEEHIKNFFRKLFEDIYIKELRNKGILNNLYYWLALLTRSGYIHIRHTTTVIAIEFVTSLTLMTKQ